MGLPWWLSGKESTCNAGDTGGVGLVPGLGRSLEKETSIHSSILAWKIPWIEEPGRLQYMGLQRVGHDRRVYMHQPYHIIYHIIFHSYRPALKDHCLRS